MNYIWVIVIIATVFAPSPETAPYYPRQELQVKEIASDTECVNYLNTFIDNNAAFAPERNSNQDTIIAIYKAVKQEITYTFDIAEETVPLVKTDRRLRKISVGAQE